MNLNVVFIFWCHIRGWANIWGGAKMLRLLRWVNPSTHSLPQQVDGQNDQYESLTLLFL